MNARWSFVVSDYTLRVAIIVVFAVIRFRAFPLVGFRWFDVAWIVVGWLLGYAVSEQLLCLRHRDVLREIVQHLTEKA